MMGKIKEPESLYKREKNIQNKSIKSGYLTYT